MNTTKRAKKGKQKSANLKKKHSHPAGNSLSKAPSLMAQPNGMRTRVMKGAQGTGLSRCAELYAKALVNPFGEFDELPCVPCTPADLTYRFRNIVRGSMSTGTSGVGFISWSPLNPTNNVASVFHSDATFAGTSFALPPTVGVLSATRSQLPFPSVAFSASGNNASARLVGSGLRIKNTTANLYKQGSLLAVRLATGAGLNTYTAAQLQQDMQSVKDTASRDGWFNWNWIPQDQEDVDFPDEAVNYGVSPKAYANFGILVQGASTVNTSTFDFEIVEFWEFVSNNPSYPVPSLVKSHADPVGQARVLEAVAQPVQSLTLKEQARTVSENIVDAMAHSDSAAKTVEDLLGLVGMALPTINTIVGSLSAMIVK